MLLLLSSVIVLLSVAQAEECPKGSCSEGSTCCAQDDNDSYACCPFHDAVCCSDFLHCCPSGTVCDLSGNKCIPRVAVPYPHTLSRRRGLSEVDTEPTESGIKVNNDCRDGTTCPPEGTCCDIGNGAYGCCPHPNAVCCSDQVHCCKENEVCGNGTCSPMNEPTV